MSNMPYTIAILSGKGGVGKTTISLNLSRELSRYVTVWLVDIDLFNRGATSALWESEKEIPLSVASLILDSTKTNKYLQAADPEKRARAYETELGRRLDALSYDDKLAFLPAARAKEGRTASYLLWKGFSEKGGAESAIVFLRSLLQAIEKTSPGCIVVLDGHGGLDDLSLAAAHVSDICYIVNEPDLITFTGSLTLYREIRDTEDDGQSTHIEFIINRVAPTRSIYTMQRDFGDVLATMSSERSQPVAAYFPLERELFGVFGDDPFVYEIYTQFWFSRKIRMIAQTVIERAIRSGRIASEELHKDAPKVRPTPMPAEEQQRNRTRYAIRRELYKRGDLLLTWWLAFSTLFALVLFLANTQNDTNETFVLGILLVTLLLGSILIFQTYRWSRVQLQHVRNAGQIRGAPGRRLRFGSTRAAKLRDATDLKEGSRQIRKNLQRAAIVAVVLTVLGFVVVPPILKAAARSKQKRTMEDLRSIATAVEAMATDYNYYVGGVTFEQLKGIVSPIYLKTVPATDAWGTPFRWLAIDCGQEKAPHGDQYVKFPKHTECQHYAIGSAGADKKFEFDDLTKYEPDQTKTFNDDLIFADGNFVRSPDTVPASLERERRTRAMNEMRTVAAGLAVFSKARGGYPRVASFTELLTLLDMKSAPSNDPWEHPYAYSADNCIERSETDLDADRLKGEICRTYAIGSAGSDKNWDSYGSSFNIDAYKKGPTTAFTSDLVLRDGEFIRAPGVAPAANGF